MENLQMQQCIWSVLKYLFFTASFVIAGCRRQILIEKFFYASLLVS